LVVFAIGARCIRAFAPINCLLRFYPFSVG
jgi:hypothetical protein